MAMRADDGITKIIYSREEIALAVKKLADDVSKDYEGKDLLLVCILKGAVVFMTDFMRELSLPCEIDFMVVSSYGSGTVSSGKVEIKKDLSVKDLTSKDVLIVEDIIDSGISISEVTAILRERGAQSVRVCTLFDKPEGRKREFHADYVGLKVPYEFIVGYGLDYNEKYRNLPYIGVLSKQVYSHEND